MENRLLYFTAMITATAFLTARYAPEEIREECRCRSVLAAAGSLLAAALGGAGVMAASMQGRTEDLPLLRLIGYQCAALLYLDDQLLWWTGAAVHRLSRGGAVRVLLRLAEALVLPVLFLGITHAALWWFGAAGGPVSAQRLVLTAVSGGLALLGHGLYRIFRWLAAVLLPEEARRKLRK